MMEPEMVSSPFHVVTRLSDPQLLPVGGEMFVAHSGTLAQMRSGRLSFSPEFTGGADTCGAFELALYGDKSDHRWLTARFPPSGEAPPRDRIYSYVPSQKSWRPLTRQPAGGVDLMLWGEALIGTDTHWGEMVSGARIRILDGKTKGVVPGTTRSHESDCDQELGGLEVRQLGSGSLLLFKPTCEGNVPGRAASVVDEGGSQTPFEALPLSEGQVFGSGAGPVTGAGAHVWVAFEEDVSTERRARLLHHDGVRWSIESVPEFSFVSSMSALFDGTLWMVSGEPGLEGSTLWRRSGEGEFTQIALPEEVGAPTSVHAAALDDVWVSTTLAVLRTVAPEEVAEFDSRALSSSVCGEE
jgi:hypothetical protein